MTGARHVLAVVVLIGGAALEVLAVLGVTIMRDAFDRLHYVSLAGFGALLVGIAIFIQEGFSLIGDKSLLVGFVFVAVGPVLVHTTARSFIVHQRGDWRAGIEGYREEEK